MPPHWVSNVADSGHLPVELWHWAVLLDLLSEGTLGPEGLVRRHFRKDQTDLFQSPQRLFYTAIYHLNHH